MKTNKLIIVSVLFLSFSFLTKAQSADEIGKIALSVIMPENADGLDASQLSKLESKIIQITTKAGLSASGFNQNFVIYPKFAIYETNIVEGGMQNITVVMAELSLYIKQVSNNVLFSSVSKSLKGSGKTKEIAVTNAISQIPTNDPEFKTFIETGKSKIIRYYETKCDDIISKADGLIKREQFEEAIGLLLTIPEEVPECYAKVQEKTIQAYLAYKEKQCQLLFIKAKGEFEKNNFDTAIDLISQMDPTTECYKSSQMEIAKYQEKACKQIILKAKIAIASKNYSVASNYLMQIHPETSCYLEAQTIIQDVERQITDAEKREWDFKQQQYKDNVALEKNRINAIKEIAVSYYKSQPATVNYNYIVK